MAKKNEIATQLVVSPLVIQQRIHEIRGEKVMLDRDLAELYGVEVRVLNQAVKRNIERFPEDFMFRLDNQEFNNLRSQIVISSWGGDRYAPYAFTEQGVAMLSAVLKSPTAIAVSIGIMKAFVELRHLLVQQQQKNLDVEALKNKVERLENALEDNLAAVNDLSEDLRQEIDNIYTAIGELSVKVAEPKPVKRNPIGFHVSKDNNETN